MNVKKIVCFCGAGYVTSMLMAGNVRKVLEVLGKTEIEVEHATLDEIHAGTADLYVCGEDLVCEIEEPDKAIGLRSVVSMPELTEKLKKILEAGE